MASALDTLIGRPVMSVFREAAILRRQSSDGKFESTWQDISEFVSSWGSFDASVDDVRLNSFTFGDLSLTVRNDTGKFNQESNGNSFWNGYLTRYRTKVRIRGGYYDENGAQLPADPTQGIYVLTGEIPIDTTSNEATLNCKSLSSIFAEVQAKEIAGLGVTLTASEIIARIRDHTDGASNFVFREFITSTAWSIQSTTAYYNLATTTSINLMTAWDLMEKVAESEGFVVLITRAGGLTFKDRNPNTTTASFTLYGQGYPEQNIISIPEIKEPLDRLYNYFRLKFRKEDTATSYVSQGTTTTINGSNISWKYGSRMYDFENQFFADTTAAQHVVDVLFSALSFLTPKLDVEVQCKFLPAVDVLDRIEANYQSFGIVGTTLWDFFDWDVANWDSELGENVNWSSKAFMVIDKETDMDGFTTTLKMQEL